MKTMLLLTAFSLLLLSGCSQSKLEQSVDEDVADYQGASCAFKFDEGNDAVSLRSSEIKTSHFKKQYDHNLLLPVLDSSGEELIRFARTTNVEFYRTAGRTRSGCNFAESLTPAPSDLDSKFEQYDFRNGLLGLYLPKNSQELPSTNAHSAIVVRIDTNKWVLIHEFMHHLFRLQEVKNGFDSSLTPLKYSAAEIMFESAFLDFRTSSNKAAKADEVFSKLKAYNSYGLELFRSFPGEEMTIESILADRMDQGLLGFVYAKQRMNGAGYIISNAKKAQSLLADIRKINEKAKKEIAPYLNASDALQLTKLSNPLDDASTEIDALVNKAKTYARSQGYTYRGMADSQSALHSDLDESVSHTGCSHGEIPPEVAERIKSLADRL